MEPNYLLGIFGTWLMADGIVSIKLYHGKEGETWVGTHSIRLVRIAMAIAIMVMGVNNPITVL